MALDDSAFCYVMFILYFPGAVCCAKNIFPRVCALVGFITRENHKPRDVLVLVQQKADVVAESSHIYYCPGGTSARAARGR